MSVQGIDSSTHIPALRLVQSAQTTQPVRKAQAVQSAQRSDPVDSYQFQSVRETQLPRMPYTQAQQRLDKLRDLVAAKTNVPVYFDEPTSAASAPSATNNPYARTYLKFPVNAAERNASATESQNTL